MSSTYIFEPIDCESKPGVCPHRRWGVGTCAEFCSNDSDCPNDEKCCHNGCGHDCILRIYFQIGHLTIF
uniref:WAP domain-containing protein n=1 Tax=Hucho hucho TaxID=62062 RepID=A0A4W5NUD6_9TELE